MDSILVLTDFSENSWNSILYILYFFKQHPVNFYLLHVVDNKQGLASSKNNLTKEQEKFIGLLEELAANSMAREHKFYSILKEGNFINVIRKQVKDLNIDLIAMATDNTFSKTKRKTIEVTTKIKCPTIVVPKEAKFTKLTYIAFPSNFIISYRSKALQALSAIANMYNASVNIIQFATANGLNGAEQQNNKAIVCNYLKENNSKCFTVPSVVNGQEQMQQFVNKYKTNLIAIAAKNISFFQDLIIQPPKQEVTYHNQIPLLVLHE